jgi:S1-C subfamily serine protease
MLSIRTNFCRISIAMLMICTGLCAVAGVPDANTAASEPSVATGSPASAEPSQAIAHAAENAVVKVFSTAVYPDFSRPWSKQAPAEITGSGVVIEGHRILTNAHVVLYASQIQVQANQAGDKISASVVAIAPGIDLAVLKLDDDSFFDRHKPLPRADSLPQSKDAVYAYGFPTGGDSLSITKGIVSRVEFSTYGYSVSGLTIQIDAAINPGNSGGPAVAGDKMIGLAFRRLGGNTQNIGYIIPNEEIELFLRDIADGHYDGKPAIYDELQTLENPALRKYLKLDDSVHGIVVHQPFEFQTESPLKEWDVVTRIGDTPVDDQGMVNIGDDLRVSFRYLVQKTAVNGKVPLTIVRAGKTQQLQLTVRAERPLLMPELNGAYPSYFIYGPLVFIKATQELAVVLANNAGSSNALSFIRSPLITERGSPPTAQRQELVLIAAPLFPHQLSKGYANPVGSVVSAVNGIQIRSLAHLVSVLRDLKSDFVTFEFDRRGGETLVFPRKEMIAATEQILADNDIRAQASTELLKIWQGGDPR